MGELTRVNVDIDGKPIPRGRVSKRLAKAIKLIVENGLTITDAAQIVGYAPNSLNKALGKPFAKAHIADIKRAWKERETANSWRTIVELRDGAQSEKVRLEAAKVFVGDDGDDQHGVKPGTLINITRNEQHIHVQPPNERLPGVVEILSIQDISDEPLDQ